MVLNLAEVFMWGVESGKSVFDYVVLNPVELFMCGLESVRTIYVRC